MSIVIWVVFGLFVGQVAKIVMPGHGHHCGWTGQCPQALSLSLSGFMK